MKCDETQSKLIDFIEHNLLKKDTIEVAAHLKSCKSCETELKEMQQLLNNIAISEIEHPSENLRLNFEQMLSDEKQRMPTKVVKLQSKPNWKSYLQIAASIALIVSAFLLGRQQNSLQFDRQVTELKNEGLLGKQTTMLALMENKSASKRIKGVQYIEEFSDPDPAIVNALVERMLHDENSNVRLTAVNALQAFITTDIVKEGYIKVLDTEKDPGIQIIVIQLLVKIQSEKAMKPMQKLLEQEETQSFVKEEIKTAISNHLI
tara:strand:- start:373883 stop:374668 length:786 start_codon:yes stop_codon:yes gene_type:complete